MLVGSGVILTVPALRARFGIAPESPSAYSPGQLIDLPTHFYREARYTVIIFARASCPACERAKPFLTRLVNAAHVDKDADVRLIMSSTGARELAEFAAAIGIRVSAATEKPANIRLHSVPTVVVVDQDGTVVLAHEGVPDPEQEAGFMRALISVAASR
jgi:glutaredoxin